MSLTFFILKWFPDPEKYFKMCICIYRIIIEVYNDNNNNNNTDPNI